MGADLKMIDGSSGAGALLMLASLPILGAVEADPVAGDIAPGSNFTFTGVAVLVRLSRGVSDFSSSSEWETVGGEFSLSSFFSLIDENAALSSTSLASWGSSTTF